MAREKKQTKKIVINVTEDLFNRVDVFATEMNLNRTAAVTVLISQALDHNRMIKNMNELVNITQSEQLKIHLKEIQEEQTRG